MVNVFNEERDKFKPYGLTCEIWSPNVMHKPDRHNEIELNFIPRGEITYLFQGKKITFPGGRLCAFWGLIPHQIVQFKIDAPYYVCTIPFSLFLEWNLPSMIIDRILNGEILFESNNDYSFYDEFLFKNWITDLKDNKSIDITLLEIQARLKRLVIGNNLNRVKDTQKVHTSEISHVEKMAIYIAQNYQTPIKASNIATTVGLHPDYANYIFKKTFGSTLSEYLVVERISHAQIKLVTSKNSITEIAYDCGFNSISRFNASFLKINKCTPREYRKMYKV